MSRQWCLCAAIAAALATSACHRAPSAEHVLARVGDRQITDRDLQQRIDASSPLVRARYATVERRRELLETIVRDELLVQEARRRHLEKSPRVQAQLDRALVQEMLQTAATELSEVTAADVQKYYDDHRGEYVRPEAVRLSHIFLVADARNRAAVAKEAEKLRRTIDEEQRHGDLKAFAVAAKQSADPATRDSGGVLRLMTEEELGASLGVAAAKAAFALKTPGEIAGPVEVPRGFEIVRLELRTVGSARSLDELKDAIRAQLVRQGQSRVYEQLLHDLRQRTGVRIDDAALASMTFTTATQVADAAHADAPRSAH